MKRKWMRPLDLAIAGAVLLAGILLLLFARRGERGDTVRVFVNDDLYAAFSLDAPPAEYRVQTEHGTLTLSLTEAGVCVTESDCRDGVCVRTGKIAKSGESIVCAPLGIAVTVGESVHDGVTG